MKAIRGNLEGYVPSTVNYLKHRAEATNKAHDHTALTGNYKLGSVSYACVSFGLIVPLHFLLLIAALKLGPNLVTDSSYTLKLSEMTSISVARLRGLGNKASMNPGFLIIYPGFGSKAGPAPSNVRKYQL